MSKSAIQQRINPPTPPAAKDFNVGGGKFKDPESEDQIDFLKLLNNSNSDIKRERQAQKNGDLSGAENYDEFLESLRKQTEKLREPKNKLDKDDFLKLFVTQLQNQDPLSPEDSTEMASRLAQFNGLEQMLNMNKTLEKMHTDQTQSRQIEMVDYIGKEVTLDGGRINVTGSKVTESTFMLKRPATSASLEVRDGSGTVVLNKKLGTLNQGDHRFRWDGRNNEGELVANGNYTYAIVAKGVNDDEVPVSITSKTKITGVDIKSKDGGLFTPLGLISLDDIKAMGNAGFNVGNEGQKLESVVMKPGNQPTGAAQTPKNPVALQSEPASSTAVEQLSKEPLMQQAMQQPMQQPQNTKADEPTSVAKGVKSQ